MKSTVSFKPLWLAMVAIAVGAVTGCASIDETHYLQANDSSGKPVNYFRLTVKGTAQSSRARYISGYFDESAVDLFFDEYKVSDQDSRRLIQSSSASSNAAGSKSANAPKDTSNDSSKPADAKGVTVAPLGGGASADGKAFVMILSTNAKGVVDQIGSFVDSQVFAETLAMVANRDKFAELTSLNINKAVADKRYAALKTELDDLFKELKDVKTELELTTTATRILVAIVTAVDGPTRLKSFSDAKAAIDAIITRSKVAK